MWRTATPAAGGLQASYPVMLLASIARRFARPETVDCWGRHYREIRQASWREARAYGRLDIAVDRNSAIKFKRNNGPPPLIGDYIARPCLPELIRSYL